MEIEKEYIPVSDAIKLSGKSKSTIWRLMKDGKIPYEIKNNRRYIERKSLERYLSELSLQEFPWESHENPQDSHGPSQKESHDNTERLIENYKEQIQILKDALEQAQINLKLEIESNKAALDKAQTLHAREQDLVRERDEQIKMLEEKTRSLEMQQKPNGQYHNHAHQEYKEKSNPQEIKQTEVDLANVSYLDLTFKKLKKRFKL